MNDSFSLLAKSIRQNKINKNELLNNLKKISEAQSQKEQYFKKILLIQKNIRGHLFRIKYRLLLEEINIKTVIDYLYEKKKKRIHEHSNEIISFFILKYINKRKRKKNNIYLEQYKIHCANLIKARLKGIITRKKIKQKLSMMKKAKNLILKHILSLRTILILKSSAIQNLLCDIAKIKNQLKSCSYDKKKELRNKLNKNINLFYDTYFYAKDNCNWGNEEKDKYFNEKWDKKYFDIINIDKSDEKIKNGGNMYQYYFENNNADKDNKIIKSTKRQRTQNFNSSKIIQKNLCESSKNKNDIQMFQIQDKENIYKQNQKAKYRNSVKEKNNGINHMGNSKYASDKNLKMNINDVDLNNINNKLFFSSKKINGFVPKEEIQPISMNNYYQMEEREIKPLKSKDILNCKNPFGIRDVTYKKSNTFKEIDDSLFYKTDTDFAKRNSAKIVINRDEKPIGGNKINYNELFGQDGELKFEGDPFGGAKQFETKKDKINNISKSSKIKKKPIYDARKAIEEAKIKENKNLGEKEEKHDKFRQFLKEIKKINCNNNKISNSQNTNKKEENVKIMKRYSENINFECGEKINGINIIEPKIMNDYFEGTKENNINNSSNNKSGKREKSLNKSQILRQKLHELEKTPAPSLNKKGIKSKVNCWFNKESPKDIEKNKNKIENYIDMKLVQLNLEINKIDNGFNINSFFEQKEEKMKKYRNIPYIKANYEYVKYIEKIDVNEYQNILNDIDKEYKILK